MANGREYQNFDIIIEQAGDRYRARVIHSPCGQAMVGFDSPFSPLELENFVLRMGRPQIGMRRLDSPEMEAVKIFGTRLFKTVFCNDVYACYLRSMDNVLNQGMGLRIRLRINVPDFHNLPWEYLYNPQIDQFLALSKDTPIIRYVELPYTTQALPVDPPLKILVMISSPEGYPPLNVEGEWKRLNKALQPLSNYGLVMLEKLEYPTLSALQQKLRKDQIHIFHYIGHGKYFEQKQDGLLLLEDDNHHGRPISGQHLGAILHDHHTLRLVILNACEGARTSSKDPYAGVAQTLVRQGIPAVLAMQFEIFEDAATTLAYEFYSALVDNYPVDAALSEARKAIFAAGNDVEWGTPVLFTRAADGVLFRRIHYVGFNLANKFAREESRFRPAEFGMEAKGEQKEKEEIDRKKAEAIRIAREREQLEQMKQLKAVVTSTKTHNILEQKVIRKLWTRGIIAAIGIIVLALFCVVVGQKVLPFIFPLSPPTITQAISTPVTAIPTIVPTQIPAQPPTIPVVSPTSMIPTATQTSFPTLTASVIPFFPQEPDQFMIFYFNTVVYATTDEDYQLGWSLLTERYRSIHNHEGFDKYKEIWEKVNDWEIPIFTISQISPSRVIVVSAPRIKFHSTSWYYLNDRVYCLTRDESRNTWVIDGEPICGL